MDDKEEMLSKNIREFYSEGTGALSRGAYNSAASLFFKALAVLADLIILREEGFVPKNHTERFRILEKKYPDVYELLDKDFPAYQDSYTISLTKGTAEVLMNDVRKVAKKIGFELD